MKLVYICDNIVEKGGIERIILTKANYFSDILKYKVMIIVTSNKKKENFYNVSKNIEVIDLNLSLNSIINIFKYSIKVKKILNSFKPDIVMVPTGKEGMIYPFIYSKNYSLREIHFSKRSRIIQNEKLGQLKKNLNVFYNFIESKTIQKYNKLIVLTEEDKKEWKHKDIEVIHNAKTINSNVVAELKNKKAISIGRLDYQKGFDRLIKSWSLVAKNYKEWTLEIYGEGPLENELKKLIKELNLEDRVFLKGVTKNIKNKLLESSLYIMSSRHEGLPLVLLEAMECGLPIVSFLCPCGPKDVIKNDYNGFLIEDNNISEMATKIEKLIEDMSLRLTIGKNSKKESEKYSIEKIMKKWEELIYSACKNNR